VSRIPFECACGCGQPARGKYVRGHNARVEGAKPPPPRGAAYPWCQRKEGRWYVMGRDYRYYKWSRVVLENHLGRELTSSEQVHHKNEDKSDDRPENLEIMSCAEHSRLHEAKRRHAREVEREAA